MQIQTSRPSVSEAEATRVQEALARGEDPLGDNDPLEVEEEGAEVQETTQASAGADEPQTEDAESDKASEQAGQAIEETAKATKQEEGLDAEALAAVAADEPEIVPLRVDATDFAAKRKELDDKEDAIEARWSAGEITDADRSKELRSLRVEQNELTRQETRAETIADMNRQQAEAHQVNVLRALSKQSKDAGQLDYSDAKVGAAFDGMMRAVSSDPANEGKSFRDLVQLAHNALCAVRGVQTAPSVKETVAAATRKAPAAPVTLRGLPAASTPNTGGDALEALGNLKGQDYQDAFARLSPAQKAKLLDEA